MFIPHTKIS